MFLKRCCLVLFYTFTFLSSCTQEKPSMRQNNSYSAKESIKKVSQKLANKVVMESRKLRIDYFSCRNFENEISDESSQITDLLLEGLSDHFDIASNVDVKSLRDMQNLFSKIAVSSSLESDILLAWKELQNRKKGKQSYGVLLCYVGRKRGGIMIKTLLSLKLYLIESDRTVHATEEWIKL